MCSTDEREDTKLLSFLLIFFLGTTRRSELSLLEREIWNLNQAAFLPRKQV